MLQKRRDFLKLSTLSALPIISPGLFSENGHRQAPGAPNEDRNAVYFINDGIFYKPEDYISLLQDIQKHQPIARDSFAEGGTMKMLLQKFTEITGKQAAVYLPSGTLANQLAISRLCGVHTKAIVQETSHVYRDEGDASQTLFNKRLIPLAPGKSHFTVEQLEGAISYHQQSEAFGGHVGAISIETPVRRCDNQAFPFEEIQKISAFCKQHGYKLHLDGARLHVATAFTGISLKQYADCFDTVYMCLYKYLGATGGAVLCGDQQLIDQMQHLIKIHGGSIFTNWPNAAVALHHLNSIDEVLQEVKAKAEALFEQLRHVEGFHILALPRGTNLFNVKLKQQVDAVKLNQHLREKHNIVLGTPREDGYVKMKINPTLLRRNNTEIVRAIKDGLEFATV